MEKSSSSELDRPGMCAGVYRWVDERLGLSAAMEFARKKTVPEHRHSSWYYWGGISLFLFLVQAVTGVLLLVYYRPGAEAYDSVREITFDIHFGWLIRSTHSWAANLMVAAVFVHMFSVFFMRAYRKPREFGWWSGLALLLFGLFFGFSGYLLPMDELSYFATKIGLEIPNALPGVGPWIADLIRGGPEVSHLTVQRFFTLHVVVLPALFIPVLVFHLWLVQRHGNALPAVEEAKPESDRRSVPFFPNFALKDLAMWLIALNVLAILAALWPWQVGPVADPMSTPSAGIHPEWYFMSAFQMLKVFGMLLPGKAFGTLGEMVGMVVFTLGLVLWALVPLFDADSRDSRRARLALYFGLFVLGVLGLTTIWGYVALG
jgi:quinol-cytochrome oxidoreductase complex cytochrome b subunit